MEFKDLKKVKPRYIPYGLTLFGPATVPKSDFKGADVDLMILRPGEKAALHIHKTGQEIYFVLDGEGVIQVGEEKTRALHKDQAVYVSPSVPRRLENTGSEDFRILVFLLPPFRKEDYEVIEKAVADAWDEDHRRYNEFWEKLQESK